MEYWQNVFQPPWYVHYMHTFLLVQVLLQFKNGKIQIPRWTK